MEPSPPPSRPSRTTSGPDPAAVDVVGQLSELLVRSSWRLRRGAAKELAPLGVTFGQARALRVLAAGDPMRMADLAASLEIVPRSVTTMIDSLVSAGLVDREADTHDRRSVLVTPTAAGRAVLDRMDSARRATAEDLFGRLNTEQREQLLSLLVVLSDRDAAGATASVGGA
jgi:DNA-binding MarR family transcriptional regulator